MVSRNMVEGLEGRKLMAATAALIGDVLFVRGEALVANEITVTNNADPTKVDVSIVSTPLVGSPATVNATFDKADFVLLKVRGGVRADTITLGTNDSPYAGNSRINGLSGADTINGGDGSDRIAGGKGNDVINGNGGNDRIHGELGSDTINGGDGNDVLWGGGGDDSVSGGAGNDILGGVLGTNVLVGGDGADRFVVKQGGQSQATDYLDGTDVYSIIGTGQGDSVTPPTA
jgi:Ca2+-binding RTX toxin-like protein